MLEAQPKGKHQSDDGSLRKMTEGKTAGGLEVGRAERVRTIRNFNFAGYKCRRPE